MTLIREHYIPLLTGKQGEFQALRALDNDAPAWLSPYIDMPPIAPSQPPKDGVEGPRDPPQVKLAKLLEAVSTIGGTDRRVMVDLAAYDRYSIEGRHPAEWLYKQAADRGIWLMGAAGTDSSPGYRAALQAVSGSLKGLCLRARATPGTDPVVLGNAVQLLAGDLPTSDPAFTYVLLDLGRVVEHNLSAAELQALVLAYVQELQKRGHPVSAVAGTSMPAASVKRGKVTRERRREWRLWQSLASEPLAATIAFADYGITGPRSDDDSWKPGPDPHLRYTTSSALLLWRGRSEDRVTDPEDPDGQAILFPELCRQLLARTGDFNGCPYSLGDAAIWDAARGAGKPGNGTKWIEFATNHHLTHVVKSLRQL